MRAWAATVPVLLAPAPAWAGRAVIVGEGTAGPGARMVAAGLVLLPIVAVLVFALARWLVPQGDPDP